MSQRSLSADQQMAEARSLASKGQVEAAKRIYHQILAQQPGNKKARKALKALQSQPGGPLTRDDFDRVTHLMRRGKLEAARAEASQLVRLHPEQPALHNLLGVIHTRMERPEAAIEDYRRALQLEPDFADAINNLGSAYNKLKRYAEAARCYQALLNSNPRDPDSWYNLGNSQRGMKANREAVKSYQTSLKLRPISAETYHNLGNTYVDLGDAENAIACYESALGIREDFHAARRGLATTYFSQGQGGKAGSCYQRILKDLPNDVPALRGLANVQNSAGMYHAAAETFSKVLALSPGDANARHHLDALQHRRSERAPEAYVRSVFNAYAVGFEEHLGNTLGYAGPTKLRSLYDQLNSDGGVKNVGLDLGCGTGLAGVAFSDVVTRLTGIDLAAQMLQEAEKKGVYHKLIEGDLLSTLPTLEEQADLILCADTLVYLGRLDRIFAAVAAAAAPGAQFLFTTEHLLEGEYELLPSARYAHSRDYVEACATGAGLELKHFEITPLRMERNEWLDGGFYCLVKPG
ncbi:tetratricopeptide repeat protein [Parahaliea aestuarii]|uniref:Tetratricopeptide repeat protein n=1 Tax=Parahaliea aestuarii TaxID=1852021 RepID=A0A5C8ZXM0_9GAMM|nr:tetratricopeptide repeat protein [Parahaliea aestuarii]TXS92217.1 tetratricopeptide repeat protein [Parahaliea aestuarii]